MSSAQLSLTPIQTSKPMNAANGSNPAGGNTQSDSVGASSSSTGASAASTTPAGAASAKGDFQKVLQEKAAKTDSQSHASSVDLNVQQVIAWLLQLGAVQMGASNQAADSSALSKGASDGNASAVSVNLPKLLELVPNLKQYISDAFETAGQSGMAQNQLQMVKQLLDKANKGPIQLGELKLLLESANQSGANAFQYLMNAAVGSDKGSLAAMQFKQPLRKELSAGSADSQSVQVRQIAPESNAVPRAAGSVWINQIKAESLRMQPVSDQASDQASKKLTMADSNAPLTSLTPFVQQPLQSLIRQEDIKVPVGSFPEQLQTLLVKNAVFDSANGQNTFKLTLLPEGLGQIQVIVQSNGDSGTVSVQLLADTTTAKDLLNSTLSGLRTGLEAQGVTISKLEVAAQPAAETFTMQNGFHDERSGSRGQEQKDDGRRNSQTAAIEELSAGGFGTALSNQWMEMAQSEENGENGKENINLIA